MAESKSILRAWLPHPLLMISLIFFWMFLSNSFTIGGLIMGSVLGFVIPIFTSNFWPERPQIRSYSKAVIYLFVVAYDIAVANLIVAKLILFRPVHKLNTRWVVLPLELKSPEAITVLAGTITLTPGTVSSDLSADGHSLLVHCLDAPEAEAAVRTMKSRYETRLKEIFS